VWGPAPTSVGRHTYYVSFIDDHTKFVWIYLLRQKSDVFKCFQEFQQLVERQFNKKIRSIQTDWGGEYQALNSFFKRIGIVHRVSCPHAHQQNGSAERKHRHIVEMGLTLLAHASMPLKFWDEAFLMAAFLINRLPSKVIDHQTPYERLYGSKPDYTFLRTFGCAVWPNLRPYNAHKLQFRSKRCVFLGYSNMHKGFKCLDPSEGRVYISRDVTFDEREFPFAALHSNAGARLRSEISLLPATLLNSNSTFGDAILHDHDDSTPLPANPSRKSFPSPGVAGENGEETVRDRCYFMPAENNNRRAEFQVDAPPPDVSAPGSETSPLSSAGSSDAAPSVGSSTPPRDENSPCIATRLAQSDPSIGDSHPAGTGSTGSTPGSPVPSTGVIQPPSRPITRAQHGISKPKIYSDGTVR
jgi:transposase InsO family protein